MRSKRKSRTISDAANTITRYILSRISESFGQWTEKEEKETLEFFKYKCPYTGEDIRDAYEKGECDLDHIIGHNKKKCGLHILGNLVLTKKTTNSEKSTYDSKDNPKEEGYESFIKSLKDPTIKNEKEQAKLNQDRIDEIKRFMKEKRYTGIHENYSKKIQEFIKKKYKEIKEMAEKSVKELAEELQVTYVPPSRTNMSESEKAFWEWNSKQGNKSTSYYKAALHRILKKSEKSFDDFISIIDDKTIEVYRSGGNKSELGKKGGIESELGKKGGIAALKMLLEYKANKSLQK